MATRDAALANSRLVSTTGGCGPPCRWRAVCLALAGSVGVLGGYFMKSMMVLATLLAGAPASAAVPGAEAAPATLVPLGKWQVEYAKSSCIISRAFGEGEQRILFTLRPAPSSETVRFWIIKPGPGGRGARGNAEVL